MLSEEEGQWRAGSPGKVPTDQFLELSLEGPQACGESLGTPETRQVQRSYKQTE